MTRRIIIILTGALLILALMFLLWFWLFGKQDAAQENLGGFGTAGDRGGQSVSTGQGSNTQVLIGGTTDTSTGGGGNVQTPLYVTPVPVPEAVPVPPSTPVPDNDFFDDNVDWLDGSGSGSVSFTPTAVNELNNVNIEGTAYFNNQSGGGGSGGIGLGGSLLGVAGGCIANYLAQKATAAGPAFAGGIFASFLGSVRTTDIETHAGLTAESLINCVVRALARIAVEQLTIQTVNWINSGFDGEPAFVQDFDKFFTDVADRAAGDVIQGAGLSFLCSPFQLQVRIAIAQSYARRNLASSQACTLTDVVDNVEGFLDGDFSQGGWPGLISFTTVPTNNPFGAYVGAQVSIVSAQGKAVQLANTELSLGGGFLSQRDCVTDQDTGERICGPIKTPGSVIREGIVNPTFQNAYDELNLADSIDQILEALLNSLITNVLQKGLSGTGSGDLGGQLNAQDVQAAGEAQELLYDLQAAVQRAQQYGSTLQGSIGDIQNAQENLATLQGCWESANEDSQADEAADQIAALETRIASFNNQITRANASMTQVEQIQTQALTAADLTAIRAVATTFAQAEASGAFITNAEIVNAQQNRTTLQAEMAALNQQTDQELAQCYAS